jgi:preprotein translocase subunit SecG
MLNLGSKTFFGAGFFCFLMAVGYSFVSSDYSGAVLLLVATGGLVAVGAASLTATGTAERFVDTPARLASADAPSIAPFAAALGLGVAGLGAALGAPALIAGLLVLVVGGAMWFSASWRSHPDHVSALTPRIADRFSLPFGMPLILLVLIVAAAYAISRTLLAVSKNGALGVLVVASLAVFGGGFLMASKSDKKGLIKIMAVVAAVSIAVMFIVGQSAGSRKFEKHGEGHSTEKGAEHNAEAGSEEHEGEAKAEGTKEKAGASAEP